MDEKLKIKISIADRVYPLTVDLSQKDLEPLQKKIDVMMKQFEENYAVRDKQDVLAMCFTICFTSRTKKQIDNAINGEKPSRIKKSMRFLDQYLDN
jgi:cell division protein ZapA